MKQLALFALCASGAGASRDLQASETVAEARVQMTKFNSLRHNGYYEHGAGHPLPAMEIAEVCGEVTDTTLRLCNKEDVWSFEERVRSLHAATARACSPAHDASAGSNSCTAPARAARRATHHRSACRELVCLN
jgi:hypothetical protein